MSEPVTYLVAEQREGEWMFGDDWSVQYDDIADARDAMARWVTYGRPVGVFAVTLVEQVTP